MTGQASNGILFSHAPDGVGYKLLELPPELVALLEGDNPPTLKLKSSPAAALLEAAGKTYSLRQKNTSNALMILQPANEDVSPTSDLLSSETTDPRPPARLLEVGLRAIAGVHETVELLPETASATAGSSAKGKWHERFGRAR